MKDSEALVIVVLGMIGILMFIFCARVAEFLYADIGVTAKWLGATIVFLIVAALTFWWLSAFGWVAITLTFFISGAFFRPVLNSIAENIACGREPQSSLSDLLKLGLPKARDPIFGTYGDFCEVPDYWWNNGFLFWVALILLTAALGYWTFNRQQRW